jgi:alpha-glucosidase (family GH31 glycosyl hydrolase)
MQEALVSDGRQLVTICDPHIKVDDDYHVYKEAIEKELYIKTKKGEPFVGKCWPGDSVYLDYLNEETRENWASQYSYEKYKNSTPNLWAWNDMNEPSVFELPGLAMPLDNLHTYKSLADPENTFQVEHREIHNIYGYCMHKGTYAGLVKRNPCQNFRPHVLSRSFFAGSQKYTAVWTGDTRATWSYLKATVPMLLSLSLCGISFCGGDIGGFIGDPEPELAVRWYQLGTFMPYFRAHSEINCKRREPWLYGPKYFNPIKEAIKDRYKLLPYWYTCFEEHCRSAVPVMRPIWFDEEKAPSVENLLEQERFMVGDGLLVVPILERGKSSIHGPLKGLNGRWYDFYTKKEMHGDGDIKTGLDRIGCFVKGGSIIPMFETRSHTKSTKDARECNINLFVALNEEENSKGEMYFDDGETYNYKKGSFMRRSLEFKKDTLIWEGDEECGYTPQNRVTKVTITGLTSKFETAYLFDGSKSQQKIQFVKAAGFVFLEFVAMASKNWKIVLS